VPGGSFAFVSALCDRVDLLLNGGYNLLGSILRNNDSVTTAIDQPIVPPMFPILNENLGAGWITFVRINEDPSSSELRLNVLQFALIIHQRIYLKPLPHFLFLIISH
jgi:hypothetical protein